MFLALDIGNTTIKAGVFDGDVLLMNTFFDHPFKGKVADYHQWLIPIFKRFSIHRIVYASVMPSQARMVLAALKRCTDQIPLSIHHRLFKTFKVTIERPEELGVDLLVDALASNALYPHPNIIVDLGTATKIIGVRKNECIGVAIAPGILTSLKTLYQNTALIKETSLKKPERIFGKNTIQSLASGIIFGQAHLIRGLVAQGQQELAVNSCPIIVTGGYAPHVLPYLDPGWIHEPHLSLKGIHLCP